MKDALHRFAILLAPTLHRLFGRGTSPAEAADSIALKPPQQGSSIALPAAAE
jgi:hypothetical protein